MRRRSDTLRENRRYEPIFDEKGFPRGKTQNEIGEAIEVSVFVPWGAWRALSTRSSCPKRTAFSLYFLAFSLRSVAISLSFVRLIAFLASSSASAFDHREIILLVFKILVALTENS